MANATHGSGRLPLAGLVVIDFGQIFQGPYATLLLAKGGADVIKVEPPSGEPLRRRARPGTSATLPFAMLNQNKRAVTLNLKHLRGRDLLFEMVRRADVLLENFGPGAMDRVAARSMTQTGEFDKAGDQLGIDTVAENVSDQILGRAAF